MTDQVPKGWQSSKVGDLAALVQYGSSAKTSENADGVPVLRMGNIVDGNLRFDSLKYLPKNHPEFPQLLLQPGDVLFNRTNSPELVGKTAVYSADHPAPCSFASYLIRLKFETYEPALFAAYMNSPYGRAWIKSCVTQQVGQANVSGGKLRELEIPVPPRDQQRQIVSTLRSLQSRSGRAREALDAVPPLLQKLRQSILAAAFRGDLTKDWRAKHPDVEPASKLLERTRATRRERWESYELAKMKAKGRTPKDDAWKARYREPEPVDIDGLPQLPHTWCWASLEALATRVTDGTHQPPRFTSNGVPFIVIANVIGGSIDWRSVSKWVSAETYEANTSGCVPERGDVLYTAVGSYGLALTVETDEPFMFQRHIAHIKPLKGGVRPDLLAFMLNAPQSKQRADGVARGVAQKTVTLGALSRFPIPVPPSDEQAVVFDRISSVRAAVARVELQVVHSTARLNDADGAVLATAFRGEIGRGV